MGELDPTPPPQALWLSAFLSGLTFSLYTPHPCPAGPPRLFPSCPAAGSGRGSGTPPTPDPGCAPPSCRQTLCISASPFCVKLRGDRSDPSPQPATRTPALSAVPEPGRPGRSPAPPASPGEGEGPREQKPRHPAPASPGRRGLRRAPVCATEAPARLPRRLLRARPGGGWGAPWAALPRAPPPPHSRTPQHRAGSLIPVLRCKVPQGEIRRQWGVRLGKGRGGRWGSPELAPLRSHQRKRLVNERPPPSSAGQSDSVNLGAPAPWGSFFFKGVHINE